MRVCRAVRGSFLGRTSARCIWMAFASVLTLLLVYMYQNVKGDNLLMPTRKGDKLVMPSRKGDNFAILTRKDDDSGMPDKNGDNVMLETKDDNLRGPTRQAGKLVMPNKKDDNSMIPHRNGNNSDIQSRKGGDSVSPCNITDEARINTSFPDLMDILRDPNERHAYAWIRMRIGQLWPHWIKTVKTEFIQGITRKPYRRRKVLLYMGFLSKDSATGRLFTENQFKGGFLGELVQWSDLITSLYLLGHDVTVASEVEQLVGLEYFFEPDMNLCGEWRENPSIIFTDIIGYRQIQRHLQQPIYHYRCRVRIMDCFGTEPAYNNRAYSQTHNKTSGWGGLNLNTQQFWTMFHTPSFDVLRRKRKALAYSNRVYSQTHNKTSGWGGLSLNTQQFWTMFPHSPDNSLAGFVTISEFSQNQDLLGMKQNVALVYGKKAQFFKGKADYLWVFHKNGLKLYSTVKGNNPIHDELPDFVTNMGYMNVTDLYNLMKQTKIFIGLGEPLEGPAPLEAIAHGAVYINPRFDPPFDYTKRGKPNDRKLTSQNSYVETLGEPYVYTVSINNLTEVDHTVQKILKRNVYKAYIPLEYRIEGHLQRVRSYLERQDFCHDNSNQWPPEQAVKTVLGKRGQSCKDTCIDQGLVCEPSHFHRINRKSKLQNITGCTRFETLSDIYFPAYDPGKHACLPQNDRELFSCVGEHDKYSRICPCRDFIIGQTSLCKKCER